MTEKRIRDLTPLARRMKGDWNSRALENAKWYINTVGVDQSDEDFFLGGRQELETWWLPDFREALFGRELKHLRVFEVGCGIGRMTSHLADVFGEVWAVDVSGEMIRQAKDRFGHLPNIHWIETNGVQLEELPEGYFDLGFSIYVYQHMPGKELIKENISGAFTKLKPGGLYKLHTNGLQNQNYDEIEKDTWIGATFTEAEVRRLASDIGAQLIAVQGGNTQYCWSTLRKAQGTGSFHLPEQPIAIEMAGRSSDFEIPDIPSSGDDARLGIVVSGLDREHADCNTIRIRIGDVSAIPNYVGMLRARHRDFVRAYLTMPSDNLTYVEVDIPTGAEPGSTTVIIDHRDFSSGLWTIQLSPGSPERPKIVTIRNGADYGTDVYSRGPKSFLNLYVQGLDESATIDNVRLQLGAIVFIPEFVGFVSENGTWQVNAQLPPSVEPGQFELRLQFEGREAQPAPIVLISPGTNERR